MSERLIPNGDSEFATKASIFARAIAKEPQRFALSGDDAEAMMNAATRFSAALQQARCGGGRSTVATRAKDEARSEAARIYKRCVNIIRISEDVDEQTLIAVNLRRSTGKKHARTCPQEPPCLRFVKALHMSSGAMPMHELRFRAGLGSSQSKPTGATRMELFVDLVPPGEQVPPYPGANLGGRPWYLRSYSRSPIKLAPPICRVPMLVVYWGRWADATGNVGPFSKTVVSRIEGWSPHVWAGQMIGSIGPGKSAPILEDHTAPGPAGRDAQYSVAVLDAQYRYFHPQEVAPSQLAAPQQKETRQLQGPAQSEAA